jgi:hypothetical protein
VTDVTLATAIEEILVAIITALQAEIKTDGLLEGVVTVSRADQDNPQPPVPAVLVYIDEITCSSSTMNIREEWTATVPICAVVRQDSPTLGPLQANGYAAKARATLLKPANRNLGKAYVRMIESKKFQPAPPKEKNVQIYGATAFMEIKFIARS